MTRFRVIAAGVLALALAACATPQTDRLRGEGDGLPRAAAVGDVPFFAQNTKECGPAALAMALTASGVAVTPDMLVPEVFTPAREGTLASDMIASARRHDRVAYLVPDMQAMFREIDAGRPVVVLQNLALDWIPQWHYAVVIGYDLDRGTVTLHSGTIPRFVTDMERFERTWARGDYWALLVLEPGRMPAAPDRGRYVAAAAGFEQASPAGSARAAYAAGLELWPRDLSLRMGLGNTLYGLGRLQESARAFSRAAEDHPKAADAFNNLAHVRFELGELAAAEQAARRAVGLGGPNVETYRRTLSAILGQKQARPAARASSAAR